MGPSGPLRSYQSGPTCRLRPRRHLGRRRGLVCVGGGVEWGVRPGRRAFSPAARDWLRRPDDVSDEPGDSGCVSTAGGRGGGAEKAVSPWQRSPRHFRFLTFGAWRPPEGGGVTWGGGESEPPPQHNPGVSPVLPVWLKASPSSAPNVFLRCSHFPPPITVVPLLPLQYFFCLCLRACWEFPPPPSHSPHPPLPYQPPFPPLPLPASKADGS